MRALVLALTLVPAILFVEATDPTFSCGPGNPCSNGACCGVSGFCGYGPTYCGTGCSSNCDAVASCGQFAKVPGTLCPLNVCCSQFGFCGTTSDFCDASAECQSNCGTPPAPTGGAASATAIVIGYYESWAAARSCDAWYPEQLNPTGYTHINFAFASIDGNSFNIVPAAPDTDPDLYARTTALKSANPDLKVFISVGGWAFNDPPTQNIFSDMASTSSNRQAFIKSLISFFQQYGFDGVDIDWEYPGASDRGGVPADVANYVALMSDLRTAFSSSTAGYGLTMTMPSSYWYMQNFDIVKLATYVDWFNMMEYDLHGVWDSTDVNIGPIVQAHSNLTEIDLSLQLLWRNKIPASKVVMGLGFYGRSFQLADSGCSTPGCTFSGPANAGPCTASAGTLSYSEIQDVITQNSLTPVWDHTAAVKYITWDTDQWVSYDDSDTFAQKIAYANKQGLGGVMVWSADQDDATGSALSSLVGNTPEFKDKLTSAAVSNTFVTGQVCAVSDCSTSDSCQPGYTALATNKEKPTQPTYQCKKGQHREVCCPSSAVPTGCTWRGTAPFCQGQCHDGEITITLDKSGSGKKCWTGTKALCCPETVDQDVLGQCRWVGSAPSCTETCPSAGSGLTNQVTTGSGGGGNGALCWGGEKKLCCPTPDPYTNCAWVGTAPVLCSKTCPTGKVQLYTDASGDGSWCLFGEKKYCCDPPNGVVSPVVTGFANDLNTFANSPSCNPVAGPYDRRSLTEPKKPATHKKRRLDAHGHDISTDARAQPESEEELDERASTPSVVDVIVLGRIVDTVYPLLSNYYTNSANPNLDSLTSVQLAEVQVLQNVSTNTFGNISVDALALRMAYTQATNYASEGPPDPREDVQDMICEAATSAADTGAMIVAVQSACSIQKCNKGSSGCSSKNTKRDLHDGPRDLTDFNILKRYFDQKTVKGASSTPPRPTLYTVINAVIAGTLTLLEFTYFNSGPAGSPDMQLEVIFAIGDTAAAAEYTATATQDGWPDRDPDRVVVIHFHFNMPPCAPTASGSRIQVKAMNMWHGQHAGVGINAPTTFTGIEVGSRDKQRSNPKKTWGAQQRFQLINCPSDATWSIENCNAPTAAQAKNAKGQPLILSGDNSGRLSLLSQLIQFLQAQNILVWDDGLDFMWNDLATTGSYGNWWDDPAHRRGPSRGPGGGAGGSTGLNRGPSGLTTF